MPSVALEIKSFLEVSRILIKVHGAGVKLYINIHIFRFLFALILFFGVLVVTNHKLILSSIQCNAIQKIEISIENHRH